MFGSWRSFITNRAVKYVGLTAVFAVVVWLSWLPGPRARKVHPVQGRGNVPASFELNRGQAGAESRFVARAGGYALLLNGRAEPTLLLHGRPRDTKKAKTPGKAEGLLGVAPETKVAALHLQFLGANPAPTVEGENRLPGRSNYLLGNDPRKWVTGVPHFARVRYREVFAGVDVLYYTKERQLEYDFVVRPGADPRAIRFSVEGAEEMKVNQRGNLALKTSAGRVVLHKPMALQNAGEATREIECSYVLHGGEVAFQLGDYDPAQELRIDPVLSYAAAVGDRPLSIAVDSAGNTFLAGITSSLATTPGAFQSSPGGAGDAFVAKLDSTGSTLLYATYLGGNGEDQARGIALDAAGNVIVAGYTASSNFPLKNEFQGTAAGDYDAFLTKLDPSGAQVLYSTYLGGQSFDGAYGVALDSSGNALLAGGTQSTNFPATPGALKTSLSGGLDAWIAKVDTTKAGQASLLFSTYLGGTSNDQAMAIATDGSGNAYATGWTQSANFPTANALQACSNCPAASDAFVTKLNAAGNALIYSTFLGGGADDTGRGIVVDSLDNVYVGGQTYSSGVVGFPTTPGAFQTSNHGYGDVFVSKLNSAGSALVYSTYLGGSDDDGASGIALDGAGNVYLSGYTYSADFPTAAAIQTNAAGGNCYYYYYYSYSIPCSDAIVPELKADGSGLIFSTYLGGANADDFGNSIAVDSAGVMYVAGTAQSAGFPRSAGAVQAGNGGFAVKINPQAAPAVIFDANQLSFAPEGVGSVSSPQSVLLRNMGSATLNITGMSVSGDFALQSTTCGNSVPGGLDCILNVTFAPTATGQRTGVLSMNDDAGGSPHSVGLNGTGAPPSTTSLTSSPNPSTFGQPVNFTATVSPATANGSVLFTGGAGINTSIGLNANSTATFSTATLPAGAYSVTARFSGDTSLGASTSSPIFQTVNQANSSVALASSSNPSKTGLAVTFTATVSPAAATGAINFMEGNATLGSSSLVNGTAMFSTASLAAGSHSVTAVYAGDANVLGSTSNAITQLVNSISLSAASTSATVSGGGTVNFMFTVTQTGPLTAPITFSCNPARANCAFTPASVPAGSGPTQVTVAINVASLFAGIPPSIPGPDGRPIQLAIAATLLFTMCLAAAGRQTRAKPLRVTAVLALLLLVILLPGCGGSTGSRPPATSDVVVNASSATTTSSMTFTITMR